MKISELISKLDQLKTAHGDIDVCYADNYEGGYSRIEKVLPIFPYKEGEFIDDETQPPTGVELS